MHDILKRILQTKQEEVAQLRLYNKGNELEQLAIDSPRRASFSEALRSRRVSIISEFKRRSPSRGWIAQTAQADTIALGYSRAGACALSVLTDRDYFGGDLEDLRLAASVTTLPILRKDFIIDELQILEARAHGASAILLIAAALSLDVCRRLSAFAHELGLEVLLEIHHQGELDYLAAEPDAVGVNNRDLHTFITDIDVSRRLAPLIPESYVRVSESGLSSPSAIRELQACGYQAFLMGEAFMKTNSPGDALSQLIAEL